MIMNIWSKLYYSSLLCLENVNNTKTDIVYTSMYLKYILHNRYKLSFFLSFHNFIWVFYDFKIWLATVHGIIIILTLSLLNFLNRLVHLLFLELSISVFWDIKMTIWSWLVNSTEPGQTTWMCRLVWLYIGGKGSSTLRIKGNLPNCSQSPLHKNL